MIEASNLFKLESRLKKGTKTIPVKSLEKDYILSWILVGISKSKMNDVLSFKGGTALKKFYFPNYRFSEDLDFTTIKAVSMEDIGKMLNEVYELVLDMSNIRLSFKSNEKHTNGYTFFLNFSGPLGADITRGEIKTDFTTQEKLINSPITKTLLREYDEYRDIPEGITLKIYSIEEIFLEKYLSILDKSRNQPRDVYDLWYLTSHGRLEYEYLSADIREKGNYKGVKSFDIIEALQRKESNYKRLWSARLEQHMIDLPPFEKVYRKLKRVLKSLNNSFCYNSKF